MEISIFYNIFFKPSLREENDKEYDRETLHDIARVHLPENSGDPYNKTEGETTDFALIETKEDVNTCKEDKNERDCWKITPVKLPEADMEIPNLQKVRTLGK